MTPIRLSDLATICGGELVGPDREVTGFALDSRHVREGDLFLAVRGASVDGHEFVGMAIETGAVGALVEHEVDAPHIRVHNLVAALAKLGSHFRSLFTGPVVGVTGSAGKTMTKEYIAVALSAEGPVLKTEGNRNTEYTAPLLWPELRPDHWAVVVEMAMRGLGQIAHLASFSKPTVGVVTNIGHSHLDLVGSRQGIARAKAELLEALPADGTAVLWREDEFFDFLAGRTRAKMRSFGFSNHADCRVTRYHARDWNGCLIEGVIGGKTWIAESPVVGKHVAQNVAAAVLVAHELGVDAAEAAAKIKDAFLPPMRMEVHNVNGATVVLDAYNASPASMLAAIETLAELPCAGRRLAVIAEMKELGEYSAEGHRLVGEALAKHQIDGAIFFGEETVHSLNAALGVDARQVGHINDVQAFLHSLQPGDVVLVKGSRAMELERALEPLLGALY